MKHLKFIVTVMLLLSLLSNPVFAAQNSQERGTVTTTFDKSLATTAPLSRGLIQPRGAVLSMAMMEISNKGKGVIGVFAATFCHVEVDRIRTKIFLDRFNESTGNWENVDIYEYDYSPANYPTQTFSEVAISFDITDQKPGYFYRLQGIHVAWLNGSSQGYGTVTDGIMITNY